MLSSCVNRDKVVHVRHILPFAFKLAIFSQIFKASSKGMKQCYNDS